MLPGKIKEFENWPKNQGISFSHLTSNPVVSIQTILNLFKYQQVMKNVAAIIETILKCRNYNEFFK